MSEILPGREGAPGAGLSLVIASGNPGKVAETRRILAGLPGLDICDLRDFPPLPEPAETGGTFRENALLKARGYSGALGRAVLSEDSGLVVPSLGGRPGVLSARFAGPGKSDRDNIARLLELMEHFRGAERDAFFVSVACLLRPGKPPLFFEGRCPGRVVEAPRGRGGFGYDPVFRPAGRTRTFAEMTPAGKDRLSHRRRALEALRLFLGGGAGGAG